MNNTLRIEGLKKAEPTREATPLRLPVDILEALKIEASQVDMGYQSLLNAILAAFVEQWYIEQASQFKRPESAGKTKQRKPIAPRLQIEVKSRLEQIAGDLETRPSWLIFEVLRQYLQAIERLPKD